MCRQAAKQRLKRPTVNNLLMANKLFGLQKNPLLLFVCFFLKFILDSLFQVFVLKLIPGEPVKLLPLKDVFGMNTCGI